MHISSITHNFRGLAFSHSLTKRVAITGNNFTGKSTVVDAISACLGGYTRLGKTAAKLEPLIGREGKALASMQLSNGKLRDFAITKKADGTLSLKKEKEPLSCIAFDSSLFLAAKPQDRIAMIQDAVGIKGDIIAILKQAAGSEVQPKLFSKATDLGEWLAETLTNLAAELKIEKQVLDRNTKALQALVADPLPTVSSFDPVLHATTSAERDARQREVGRINADLFAVKHRLDLLGPPTNEPAKPHRDHETASKDLSAALAKREAYAKAFNAAINAQAAKDKLAAQLEHVATCSQCGAESSFWEPSKAAELERRQAELPQRLAEFDAIINAAPTNGDEDALDTLINELDAEIAVFTAHDGWLRDALARTNLSTEIAEHNRQLNELNADLATIEANLSKMDEARGGWFANQERTRQKDEADKEIAKSTKAIITLSNATGSIKEAARIQSESIMRPVLEVANQLLEGVLLTPLQSYNFALGREAGGVWIPLESFSGCEAAATTAALQAALLHQTDVRVCIVDEVARFDEATLAKFTSNVERAIDDGLLEQAIFVGVRFEAKSNWQTINLK